MTTLSAGARLGPYEVLSRLGAGGMGEVWRARDTRLGRDVAVKVLPEELASDAERLARFEREARAIAALSHPGILAVHDVGSHEGVSYVVTDLLEGETLRERLAGGALSARKAVEIAVQVAQGLAAAHDRGIVHRDVKPENLFVGRDGRVTVLDFGLARQDEGPSGGNETRSPTLSRRTEPGVVLGTVGYMSPEQVRGRAADHRSDVFSLGCVLFEMLTGRRAFQRETSAETMTAILREEPPWPPPGAASPGPLVERIVRRCLEKEPGERFQSARDLAFALESALSPSGSVTGRDLPAAGVRGPLSLGTRAVLAALGLAAALAGGFALGRLGTGRPEAPRPTFRRLTFQQGFIRTARFTPDGSTIVYGAAWDGDPLRLFLTRPDSRDSSPLPLPDAELLSISSAGELAVSLGHQVEGWMGEGTLARVPLLGGGARPVLEGVREADWTPDGSALAVVRREGERERLEFPPGKVLYQTTGYVSHVRFSPKGDRIAFADHPIFADDIGSVAAVDLEGKKTTLTAVLPAVRGIAWSPSGEEVWFTASSSSSESLQLFAVDLSGNQRFLLGGLGPVLLLDVSKKGRVLLARETSLRHVEALMSGSEKPRDFTLAREGSVSRFLSPDGMTLVMTDQSEDGYQAIIRRSDGSAPIRLGKGEATCLSPDGKWLVAVTTDERPRILLHPTGAGKTREVSNPEGVIADGVRWLAGGRGIAALGSTASRGPRGYLFDPEGKAPPRAFTGEDVATGPGATLPASPDGSRVVVLDSERHSAVCSVDDGSRVRIRGLEPGEVAVEWTEDGGGVYAARREATTWNVVRLDLATGARKPWTRIVASQRAGLRLSWIYITPNGRFWLHSYSRLLADLYVADGLR